MELVLPGAGLGTRPRYDSADSPGPMMAASALPAFVYKGDMIEDFRLGCRAPAAALTPARQRPRGWPLP